MKYKSWAPEIWAELRRVLKEEKQKGTPLFAAFDADGTLWNTDMGENFFRYQISSGLLEELKKLKSDPWEHYAQWKSQGDPRPAYLWLAQINAGHSIEKVRAWAEEALEKESPVPYFEDQRRWIQTLQDEDVQIFIVTASVKWAVEPAARRLGIQEEYVLGVETAVVNGVVTKEPAGFMTYREGKAQALLKTTGGHPPFFCSGNTLGDQALLESSCRTRLAVRTNPSLQTTELLHSEGELLKLAQSRGWLTHEF